MNAIHELPNDFGAGLDHDYTQWVAGTEIVLCNVRWDSSYRDVVRFADQTALDTYLRSNDAAPSWRLEKLTYVNVGEPIRVPIPVNRVNPYNYVMVKNPKQPNTPFEDSVATYYYFITGITRLAGGTTAVYLQLDVFQTFGYSTTFGNCYIERGHVGIANQRSMEDFGREFLTQPEGLDVGSEYEITDVWSRNIASARIDAAAASQGSQAFSVMVVSANALDVDPGTSDTPKLQSAKGSNFENLPNGAEIYVLWNLYNFMEFMAAFSDVPHVTQGILSITVIPHITQYGIDTTAVNIRGVNLYKVNPGGIPTKTTRMKDWWRESLDNGRYTNLKKLNVSPYTMLELTTNTGTPIAIKPENWNDHHATVVELSHFAPPSPRMMFYPYKYNAKNNSSERTDNMGLRHDYGEFLDMATSINNFPMFSLVNNGYMSYMAANVNSIAFQHQSADWSQQKAQAAASLGYNQASSGMNNAANQNQIGIDQSTTATGINNTMAGLHGAQGAINSIGGAGRNPIGAATGVANSALGAVMNIGANNANLANTTNTARRSLQSSQNNAAFVRDTNKDYANFAAEGDNANAIASIQARVQDAKMIQPTTSGQVGGEAFMLTQYQLGYDVKVKRLHPGALATVGEFMLRYGYSINRFGRMPADFMVMQKFTYWKLRESYIIQSRCPETVKQTLRGIFEKGVTVWRNPNDVGNIDIADNQPLTGISL
jgi:hypothetical protein